LCEGEKQLVRCFVKWRASPLRLIMHLHCLSPNINVQAFKKEKLKARNNKAERKNTQAEYAKEN